jgi:serine/threonine protein kinase
LSVRDPHDAGAGAGDRTPGTGGSSAGVGQSTVPEGAVPTPDPQAETAALPVGYEEISSDAEKLRDLRLADVLDPPQREGSLGRIGHYEVLSIVGFGGMGCVLKAFDEQLHRVVAIKLMSNRLIASSSARQRFIREARSAAGVNHPNVVTVHAVADQRGMPYLVMEYVEGTTLQDRIKKDSPLAIVDVLRIGEQVCAGLAAAHKHGIVHRDIKPGNILLEDGVERVKIADFGLARLVMEHSDLTSMGDMVGTPPFMSPEQVSGEEIDHRSDLFSFGSVLYAMLAGHSPFKTSTPIGTAHSVRSNPHPPLRTVCPKAPDYLVAIIDRLLQKKPKDRFQSAAEVGDQLRMYFAEVQRQRSTSDPNMETLELPASAELRNQRTRQRVQRGLIAVALLAVVAFGGWKYFDRETPVSTLLQQHEASVTPGQGTSGVGEAVAAVAEEHSAPPFDPDASRDPRVWTVAQSGKADYRDLQEAIAVARPADTIEVLDGGEYVGPFRFDDPEKLANVKIVAKNGAVLTCSEPQPVVTVENTPGFELHGFTIIPGPESEALVLRGEVPGCVCQLLMFLDASNQPAEDNDARPMVLLTDGCRGASENRAVVRMCTFRSDRDSVHVVGGDTPEAAIRDVIIDGNNMQGRGRHLTLRGTVRDFNYEFNVMTGGVGGHFELNEQNSYHVLFTHNTCFRMTAWLQLVGENRIPEGVASDNLVLETPADELAHLMAWSNPWQMQNNLWELAARPEGLPETAFIRIVPNAEVPFREYSHPLYLKPAAEGVAARSSTEGGYVGAMRPVSP